MLLGTVVAGFDAAGRAKLRRAIGKKKSDLMAEVGTPSSTAPAENSLTTDGTVISPGVQSSRPPAGSGTAEAQRRVPVQQLPQPRLRPGDVPDRLREGQLAEPGRRGGAGLHRDDGKRRRVLADLAPTASRSPHRTSTWPGPPPRSAPTVGSGWGCRRSATSAAPPGSSGRAGDAGVFVSLTDLMAASRGAAGHRPGRRGAGRGGCPGRVRSADGSDDVACAPTSTPDRRRVGWPGTVGTPTHAAGSAGRRAPPHPASGGSAGLPFDRRGACGVEDGTPMGRPARWWSLPCWRWICRPVVGRVARRRGADPVGPQLDQDRHGRPLRPGRL